MKCTYKFDSINLIWMIRLDNQITSTGWCNRLEEEGEKILENFVGIDCERLIGHKMSVYHQRRYVFDIKELSGKREYVFVGAFEFSREEGDNDYRMWKKVSDEIDLDDFV